MRKFTLLSALGALLTLGVLNAHADVVSCQWVNVAYPPTGGTVQNCYLDSSRNIGIVGQRIVNTPQGCINLTASSGYTVSGTCLNPTFYTAPVNSSSSSKYSSSSSSSSSQPNTKVVNNVTIPYSATVLDQGTCYSQGCGIAYSKCTTTLGGVFATNSPYYVCFK